MLQVAPKQKIIVLNPPRVIQIGGVPLGNGISTKTLCNGQHLDVDASIADNAAVYTWNSNNGFTANTAKVTLTSVGKYWITITDSRGINASDTLIIAQNNANISARFVVTTQAFTGGKNNLCKHQRSCRIRLYPLDYSQRSKN